MPSSCSHRTSAAACVPMARVVARPLPPVRRHPLHMPPTPTSTTQPSAAPWPQRERGRRQRGHPPSMSPSSPPVRPLLTTDAQTAHAVVAQSPHVCGCLCADGSRCRASLCVLSSQRDTTLLTITCRPPLPARHNRLLFPGPGEKGDVDSGVTRRLCPLPRRLFALSRTPTPPSPASATLPSAAGVDTALSSTPAPPYPDSTTTSRAPPGPGEKGDADSGVTRRLCPLPRRPSALSSPVRSCPLQHCRSALSHWHHAAFFHQHNTAVSGTGVPAGDGTAVPSSPATATAPSAATTQHFVFHYLYSPSLVGSYKCN
jgi:hypothetical protein